DFVRHEPTFGTTSRPSESQEPDADPLGSASGDRDYVRALEESARDLSGVEALKNPAVETPWSDTFRWPGVARKGFDPRRGHIHVATGRGAADPQNAEA